MLVWLFTVLFKTNAKDAFAQSLMITLPLSALSGIIYWQRGAFTLSQALPYLIPAIPGGILGAYLTDRMNPRILKIIFALLVVYSGARMIFAK